ncbi:hypothetical protein C8R43DRAFT_1123378 [Mycena crocata]|nr:hypothetical protein C8R43DRAFT_1123378 [Mycena crocata]
MPAAVPKGTQGACDICRRQKVRCDSATMPGNRCSKCIAFDSECTHNFEGTQDACDICRRQKVRCDSATMPGNRCSRCIAFDSECTHNFAKFKPQAAKGARR